MLKSLKIVCIVALALPVSLKAQVQTQEKVKFLALGDSYTIGQSVEISARWPIQLIDSLQAKGIACDEPKIIAMTGWRTDNLKAAIVNANISNDSYNLVSLLIGVNNQYQGRTVESYTPEFSNLLDIAIELAGGEKSRVFVVSIPDYGFTPYGRNNQPAITAGINAFNGANKSIADEKGVTYINITDISRQGLAQPDLVASDGLHPSGKMYTEWVKIILDSITIQEVVRGTDSEKSSTIKVYPNPAGSRITIEHLPAAERIYKIVFRDATGKTMLQNNFNSDNRKTSLDIDDLIPGIYFYELSGKTAILKTGKLIKR
jgi:lysophospholipase L1-like esterase